MLSKIIDFGNPREPSIVWDESLRFCCQRPERPLKQRQRTLVAPDRNAFALARPIPSDAMAIVCIERSLNGTSSSVDSERLKETVKLLHVTFTTMFIDLY